MFDEVQIQARAAGTGLIQDAPGATETTVKPTLGEAVMARILRDAAERPSDLVESWEVPGGAE